MVYHIFQAAKLQNYFQSAKNIPAVNYEAIQLGGYGYQNECLKLRPIFMRGGNLDYDEILTYAKKEKGAVELIEKMRQIGMLNDEVKSVLSSLYRLIP